MNQREIRRLADLIREYGLTEIEIEREGVRVRLRRELAGPVAAPTAAAASAAPAHVESVASAMPGAAATSKASKISRMAGSGRRFSG